MATKGYNSYSGRGHRGKTALVVVLVLILLAACSYLLLQPYVVYEDDGSIRLELPFLNKKEEEQKKPELPEINEEDIHREEGTSTPEAKPEMKDLHAVELPYDCLNSDPKALLEDQSAVVVNVKQADGSFTYHSTLQLPEGVVQGKQENTEHLKTILDSKCYTVAKISALCDNAYTSAVPDAAIRYEGGSVWADFYDRGWLDPARPESKEYLCAIAKECEAQGFDELLLEHFRYPIEGELQGTGVKEDLDRGKVLTEMVEAMRKAAPSLRISVLLPGSLDSDYAFQASGLPAKVLTESFDRIYVPAGSASYEWLDQALKADYDRQMKLVLTTSSPLESGSYMIVQ